MPSQRRDKSTELQKQVAGQLIRTLLQRQYSQLAMLIEILAKANGNTDLVDRLKQVKENCSFDFEAECILFMRSFMMPAHRGIRFRGTGIKLTWQQIREIGMEEVHKPLSELSVELMGKLSETQTVALKSYIEGLGLVAEEKPMIEEEIKQPEEKKDDFENVIFDNSE
jgi:hypothetical protein